MLIAILAIVASFAAVFGTKYLVAKRAVDAADTPELKAAAISFAKRGDSLSCEDESIARITRCKEDVSARSDRRYSSLDARREALNTCTFEVLHFHRHCLGAARRTKGFCERPGSLGITRGQWIRRRCQGTGLLPNPECIVVLDASTEHCTAADD